MSREVERVWVVGDDQVLYVEWQGDERWGVAVVPVALSEAVYVEGSAMGDLAAVVTQVSVKNRQQRRIIAGKWLRHEMLQDRKSTRLNSSH